MLPYLRIYNYGITKNAIRKRTLAKMYLEISYLKGALFLCTDSAPPGGIVQTHQDSLGIGSPPVLSQTMAAAAPSLR